MNIMKRIVGSVMVALILIPLQNAQAWDNGNRGGWGGYYAQGHRGYGGPGYYGNRGYYGHNGYYGNRGYYRNQRGCWGCGSAGPVIAGLALGAIIGGAIINSAPPPPGW